MKRVLLALLCVAFGAPVQADVTKEDAVNDARSVPVPSPSSLLNDTKALEVVPKYGESTDSQRSLYMDGKGALVPPGSARTTDCMMKNDPECVAVQLVVTGRGTRPVINIPPNDPMLKFRDGIISDPKGILGSDPTSMVSNPESCSNVVKTVPPTYTVEVCDITIPASNTSCLAGLEIVVDADYLYKCLQRMYSDETNTCSVGREIVVDAAAQYKCIEQVQSNAAAACTVGRSIVLDPDYNYQCEYRPYKINTYQCTRTLSVTGTPGCTEGSMYTAVASDPGGLGKDPCNGGDDLYLSYQCSPNKPPVLLVQTNTKSSGLFSFWLGSWSWDEEHLFENCKGRFYGNTACTDNSCVTNIVMEVSFASLACVEWDMWGNCVREDIVWVYSGALGKTFPYVTWSLSNIQDQWNSTCSTLEARSK
jgi:hypothetical protein